MKTLHWIILCGCLVLASPCFAYESLQGPTEVLLHNKEKAYNGYTLFSSRGAWLIDMQGHVVHRWKIGTNPRLLDNGHLLDASKDDPSGFGGFKELDWDGKVVWEYTESRPGYSPHHDWVRIFNKKLNAPTTLYIANKAVSSEQALAGGADPKKGSYSGVEMDAIVEVDMNGKVVWEWWFFDHMIQDIDPCKKNYVGEGKTLADCPGRLNINLPGRRLKRDWLHLNSLDYNAELGQVVFNSVQGEFYVIDHDGTFVAGDPEAGIAKAAGPAGDFLYRFGDPARYAAGDAPRILEDWTQATAGHKQIGGAHDVQWIKPELPGAGHLMVFNNGQYLYQRTNQSTVLEIDGFLNAQGQRSDKYVNPPDAGYNRVSANHDTHKPTNNLSKQIVWSYGSKSNQGFFAHIGAGAQRLPNGNTLICSDTEGHLFEVTAEGELVWEYINPVTRSLGTVKTLPDVIPMTNSVFRCYRYGPDHPAFRGKDLTPKGTITEAFAMKADTRPQPGKGGQGQKRGGQGGQRGEGNRQGNQDGKNARRGGQQ